MDIYKLYRNFWDYAFHNPEVIKPNHCAVFSFAIEHCNRLGWKEKFGLPTSMVMEATGIKSYSVYKTTFDKLAEIGFFEVIEYSKNQYSSNIIALKENYKAPIKALDKALAKHISKQCESTLQSTGESIVSINKQVYNNTSLQEETNIPALPVSVFSFKKEMLNNGFNEKLVDEWLKVRKTKKATNTETALKKFLTEVQKTGLDKNFILQTCIEKSWQGFNSEWLKNSNNQNFNNGNFNTNNSERLLEFQP